MLEERPADEEELVLTGHVEVLQRLIRGERKEILAETDKLFIL